MNSAMMDILKHAKTGNCNTYLHKTNFSSSKIKADEYLVKIISTYEIKRTTEIIILNPSFTIN